MNSGSPVKLAEAWANSLWHDSVGRWSNRTGQDRSYREHVIHPALNAILSERFHGWRFRILEIGSGDGSFLDRGIDRSILHDGGAYLGIDISSELITRARENYPGDRIAFMQRDISEPSAAREIRQAGTWDCMLSIFAVQEIPHLPAMLENLRKIALPGMLIVIVTVHPDFGQWLLDSGNMLPAPLTVNGNFHDESNPESVPWRWAGAYPIVDEPLEPFYLPYFHRTTDDYRAYLDDAGFRVESIRDLPDPELDLPRLVEHRISPFCEFKSNVYWPRITQGPSSIAIIAHAEENS